MSGVDRLRLPPCRALPDWPAADREAWQAARRADDPFDDPGRAAHWAPATVAKVEGATARFLEWAACENGLPNTATPELVADETTLRAYLRRLEGTAAPHTVIGMATDLREFLRVAWPEADLRRLTSILKSLRWRARPTRDKRSKLRSVAELVGLGEDLMMTIDAAPPCGGDPRLPLADYRDGLAIALLALRPLRKRAFGSLVIDEHLVRRGERWRLEIPEALTKTGRPWEADVPERLLPALERYLSEVRPSLMRLRGRWFREPGMALWISNDGGPLSPKSLGEAIARRTQRKFGVALHPHLFRDCAATTLAVDFPEDVRLATPLLGHARPKTTQRHYVQAEQSKAGRRHLDALRRLRRG